MPLPFILGAAAIAAAGYGAKKGYDGYQDKSLAGDITKSAQADYEKSKNVFDGYNEGVTAILGDLGSLQLQIGSDFGEFRRISEMLLEKLNQSNDGVELKLNIPAHNLDKIKRLELSAVSYLGQMAGAGVAGGAAAYAVYGGVMALAAASTGTPIAALSGAAAYNATMAAIGGGSLATGGFGMAGGAMVLGGVVAAPIIAIAGWAYASHAEKALDHARETRQQVDEAIGKMDLANKQFMRTYTYVERILESTQSVYQVFCHYFSQLKEMSSYLEQGGDVSNLEDQAIQVIENGYKVAAILTDIVITPLFKPKTDADGKVVIGENNAVLIETDSNGLQVLNVEEINQNLLSVNEKIQPFQS